MFGELTCKGFQAIVLSYGADRDGLVYLRLLAPPTAGKAIWATFNTQEARRGARLPATLTWGGDTRWLALKKYTRYFTPRARLRCGYTDLAFLRPDATAGAGETFYLITDEETDGPPPAFFPVLNARLALPLLPEWAAWLWRGGLEGYVPPGANRWQTPALIKKVDGLGVTLYKVCAAEKTLSTWLAVIRRGLGFDLARWEAVEEAAA